jgi:hypothetical protein
MANRFGGSLLAYLLLAVCVGVERLCSAKEIASGPATCSPAVVDESPRRSVGGAACCTEPVPAWERDYILELVGAGPNGRCVCKGDQDNPIEVSSTNSFLLIIHAVVDLLSECVRVQPPD